jgi:bacterial/archaeal transporter family-2 protein
MSFFLHLAGLLAGASTNAAPCMNTTLGEAFAEHRMLAALVIQGIGPFALFLTALLGGAFPARPAPAALAGLPWWAWACGAAQALTVFSVLMAAGASGATLFSALTVTGGTTAAVPLDHFGLLGFARRDATLLRLAGC